MNYLCCFWPKLKWQGIEACQIEYNMVIGLQRYSSGGDFKGVRAEVKDMPKQCELFLDCCYSCLHLV